MRASRDESAELGAKARNAEALGIESARHGVECVDIALEAFDGIRDGFRRLREVLRELGYSEAAIADLRAREVV